MDQGIKGKRSPSAAQAVHQARQAHSAGRLPQAEQLYRQALAAAPNDPDALAGLAMVAAQAGKLAPARDLLTKALAARPGHPETLLGLAKVEIGLGNPAAAEKALRTALEKRRRDAVAWNLLGWCQQGAGRLEQAVESFRQAVRIKADFPEALNNLGSALMLLGRNEEAAKPLGRCVAQAPNFASAHMNLGSVLAALGREEEAVRHARRAADLAPASADVWFNLGRVHHTFDHIDEAVSAYEKAVDLAPASAPFMNNLAQVLGSALRPDEALAWAEKAAAAAPDSAEFVENLARAHIERGDLERARRVAADFLARHPDAVGMRLITGDIAVRQGRFEDARAIFGALLAEDPRRARALRGVAHAGRVKAGDPVLARMAELAEAEDVAAEDRVELLFALGKVNDDVGDAEAAFSFYARANALKNATCRYDPAAMEDHVSAVIETFTADFFAERRAWGHDSEVPTLILGMPRSGTTLVEQILSSHPAVAGGDELADFNLIERLLKRRIGYPRGLRDAAPESVTAFAPGYLEHLARIGPEAARVTDKLPGNALRLGLIALMFPRAKVIHCRRNPVDTCLSIYFQNFGGRHDYAYDLANVGHFYRQYRRLMDHWPAVVPTPILEVVYEDVVADHEAQGRRMIAHLGLDWHESMARYTENKRAVSTASVWQVRQPIYTRSVERWRRYDAHLGPLLEALGPYAPDA